jgi:hypothetical protein
LEGFESDYNVFWCEAGEPIFEIDGNTKTFTQWQALGYDLHSVIVNPDFLDFTSFVPRIRLDYGKDLGPDLNAGLAVDANWGKTDPGTANQNGIWQVGARIYRASDAKIKIYPNPAYNTFYVQITDASLAYHRVKVYDTTGRLVMSDNVEKGLNSYNIPQNFPVGIYSIALETDNMDRYVRKLLIIR